MTPLVDPRSGDVEDDALSTKSRSLFAILGSLLAEISFPKLVVAWSLLVALPAVVVCVAPLVVSAWAAMAADSFSTLTASLGSFAVLVGLGLAAWFAGRPIFEAVERGFWSLNSIVVQPIYALVREGLRQTVESFADIGDPRRLAWLRSATAIAAGVVLCVGGLALAKAAWPYSRWAGDVANLWTPRVVLTAAIVNSFIVLNVYFAAAVLGWSVADASMPQPEDLSGFDSAPASAKRWRVAHLSDLHVVGERFGFRIESGRAGPRGNERLARALDRLEAVHAAAPLDLVLITGDATDAGRSSEWAEFLEALASRPALAERALVLPGNHDINIVDRANPARFELPLSPSMRLRQVRTLSAIGALQGDRVRVVDRATGRAARTLFEALNGRAKDIKSFAESGSIPQAVKVSTLWANCFPMILPPDAPAGLGVMIFNSTAETHFSFTNALGLVPAEHARAALNAASRYPDARWIVALHHHLVEYPRRAMSMSERIGTSLINGSWLVRYLERLGTRSIVMHGHRHIDWIGRCGDLRIISAPSPVMESTDEQPTYFHVHTLAAGEGGRLLLLPPERVDVPGASEEPPAIVTAN